MLSRDFPAGYGQLISDPGTKLTDMKNANLYYMDYHDQLVLTGEVNDVGSAVRENIENSYRAGVELEFGQLV